MSGKSVKWWKTKSVNWWITKIISLSALVYLCFSISSASKTEATENTLKNEHILLFAIVLLFNSDLLEKIESFSLGDLNAKFATKEEVKDEVNKLGEQIDILLMSTVLDAYEFITLQKLQGNPPDKYGGDKYDFNEKGRDLIERLRNRGLLEKISGQSVFQDGSNGEINLRKHFLITEKGRKYLQVICQKKLVSELEEIARRTGFQD